MQTCYSSTIPDNFSFRTNEQKDITLRFEASKSPHSVAGTCVECEQPYTHRNVFTAHGVAEIQISGLCEDCFDAAFPEDHEFKED